MTFLISEPGINNATGTLALTVQSDILVREFQDALSPGRRFRSLYNIMPAPAALGQRFLLDKVGLLADADDPLAVLTDNSDFNSGMTLTNPAAVEQVSVKMNKWGNALNTNLLTTSISMENQVIRNSRDLGLNAGKSLEKFARRMYSAAYGGGTTYVTTNAANVNTVNVANAFGFDMVMVTGVQTQVSTTNKLLITVNSTSVNVTGVSGVTIDKDIDWAPATLTLDALVIAVVGDLVKASTAPILRMPGGITNPYLLTSASLLTVQDLLYMEATMTNDNVEAMAETGYYHAVIDSFGYNNLYTDTNFSSAMRGQGQDDIYARQALGAFSGFLFFKTSLPPNDTRTLNAGALRIYGSLIAGDMSGIEGRYTDIDKLNDLAALGVGVIVNDYDEESGIMLQYRAPLDLSGEVITQSWKYLGGFTQWTDSLTLTPNVGQSVNRNYGRAMMCWHT